MMKVSPELLTRDVTQQVDHQPGIERLFNNLVNAIIKHRHVIEKEKAERERDSVMLSAPTWSAVADEEERRARERASWGTCC